MADTRSLERCRAKLARALEHLTALQTEISTFFASRPYGISSKTEMLDGAEIFRVRIPDDETLRFMRFSVLAGDYLNTLRASLDHLAWALSRLTTPTPFKNTEFPIFLEAKPDAVKAKIRDAPADAQDVIERLQPYHRKNLTEIALDPLAVLYTLTNIDKHRFIPIVRYAFIMTCHVPKPFDIKIRVIQKLDSDEHIQDRPDGIAVAPNSGATLKIDAAATHVLLEKDIEEPGNLGPQEILALRGIPVERLSVCYDFVRDEVFPRLERFLQQSNQPPAVPPRQWFVQRMEDKQHS
jgi:hypothetical protein